MTDLPPGWEWTTLGEIGEYVNGRAFKPSEWSASGRPIIRIQNLTGSGSAFNYFDGDLAEKYVVRQGDFLISWAATLGSFVWNGPEAALNQHIFKVNSYIDERFHRYLVDYLIDKMYEQTHGSGMVHVTRGKFDALAVALPPLAEQRRIVESLEAQLSRLEAALQTVNATSRKIPSLETELTMDSLRCVPTSEKRLALLLKEPLANGRSVPTRADGFPVLRLSALSCNRVQLKERKGGAWSRDQATPFLVKTGDFLISRGNGSLSLVGRGGAVLVEPGDVAFPDTMIRIRPNEDLLALPYLALIWNLPLVRRQIEQKARTTAGIYKINQSTVADIELPLPSLENQAAVLRHVDSVRYKILAAYGSVVNVESRARSLRRSMLREAFAGRLVRQDPNDEPASVLLERVKTVRAAQQKTKSIRHSPKKPDEQGSLL